MLFTLTRFGLVVTTLRNQLSLRRALLILGWVTVRGYSLPSWYLASHPGLFNLAISLWVGAMSTGDGLGHCLLGKKR